MKTIALSVIVLSLIFVGCSKRDASYYMQVAKQSVKQKNIPSAVTAYENLIKKYPDSPQASQALFELASLYQNKIIKNITPKESLEKAVSLFRSIYDKYPDSKEAPKSLFMSGFILANDLNEYKRATSTFNLFLKKYPDNILGLSAKEELKNMGLSPEKILSDKTNSNL